MPPDFKVYVFIQGILRYAQDDAVAGQDDAVAGQDDAVAGQDDVVTWAG